MIFTELLPCYFSWYSLMKFFMSVTTERIGNERMKKKEK
jgi:hypothetical protein